MAARKPARGRKKKTTSKRSSRKTKTARKKPATRRKTAKRKTASSGRRKATRKTARKKPAKRAARKKAAPKKKATRKKAVRKTATRKTPKRKTPTRRKPAAPTATSAVPNAIGLLTQHMDYTSHAMEDITRFYTETLGFTEFKRVGEYLMVRTGQTSSLGFMPPMPVAPDQWQPPREPTIYLMVENVDRVYADLTNRGVEFDQAPQDTPWGHRVAMLRDPEGRTVCLAQVIEE